MFLVRVGAGPYAIVGSRPDDEQVSAKPERIVESRRLKPAATGLRTIFSGGVIAAEMS